MKKVSKSLKNWFIIHFIIDILLAIPLILIPEIILPIFGWQFVDPMMSRLVGAILFGIGVQSFIGRNESIEVYKTMLNLKILWASASIVGISLALYQDVPQVSWVFLGIFIVFWIVWVYFKNKLNKEI